MSPATPPRVGTPGPLGMGRPVLNASVVAVATLATMPVAAQTTDQAPKPRISWATDGIVTGAGVGLTWAASLIPVDTTRGWRREPFPFDQGTRGVFSASVGQVSDGLVMMSLLVPVALQTSRGFAPESGARLLIHGETLSVTLAVNTLIKSLVARPRPYFYGEQAHLRAYARRRGRDSHLSDVQRPRVPGLG